ncbi:hypothetical protein DUI87_34265 [Hirundo rustica rustica]|uniref:Uncharacterized protein n=1 Tax=Hirundo rustica rustica TaxID=333673 RepID=A0A3M0IR35_HIRRU|nr:hypothetical protein DUI87_34265 [Hirundo rustica rustica]
MAKEGAQRAEETEQMIEKEGGREAAEGGAGGSLRAGDAKEMRAVVLSAFGGLNKLRVSKKAMPEPQEGELKIRVKAWSNAVLSFQFLMVLIKFVTHVSIPYTKVLPVKNSDIHLHEYY